jgi:hypothetical protein
MAQTAARRGLADGLAAPGGVVATPLDSRGGTCRRTASIIAADDALSYLR